MGVMRRTLEGWGYLRPKADVVERSFSWPWGPEGFFTFNGNQYPYGISFTQSTSRQAEEIPASFAGYSRAAYRTNGVISACMDVRLSLFSEARLQFRRLRSGRPGALFGNEALAPIERPWPNGTTGDLLARAIQDADLAGNFYARRQGNEIQRLRPDWVSIVIGSNTETDSPAEAIDARPIGYLYHPGGRQGKDEIVVLRPEEVCHWDGLKPDPEARFIGMSWLTPILRELQADTAATDHKLKALEEGGVRNAAVQLDTKDPKQFKEWVDIFSAKSDGLANAYKRLYLASGMTVIPLGLDMVEMDLKAIQGAGETRIAAAAGVPPVIVGLSEGLAAATYSNYQLAMRRFADLTMRPLWRSFCGAIASIIDVPEDAELWYDDRDIPALKEDIEKRADVQSKQAAAARQAVDGGWEPDSIVAWLASDDINQLTHTGLPTVQVQEAAPKPVDPSPNGQPEDEGTVAERVALILEGVTT